MSLVLGRSHSLDLLVLQLLNEQHPAFSTSSSAATLCPRLLPRMSTAGHAFRVPIFTRAGSQLGIQSCGKVIKLLTEVSRDGTALSIPCDPRLRDHVKGQSAVCEAMPMCAGKSYAEFTVTLGEMAMGATYSPQGVMIGVATRDLPLEDFPNRLIEAQQDGAAAAGSDGGSAVKWWGVDLKGGKLHHAQAESSEWEGRAELSTGHKAFTVGLLLDSDAGTLSVWQNGAELGVANSNKWQGALAGRPLFWTVTLCRTQDSVEIRAHDPAEMINEAQEAAEEEAAAEAAAAAEGFGSAESAAGAAAAAASYSSDDQASDDEGRSDDY
eukprot:COSAG04_NODE_809_length_10142_cov_3.378174_3_plen_325_part_00